MHKEYVICARQHSLTVELPSKAPIDLVGLGDLLNTTSAKMESSSVEVKLLHVPSTFIG